MTRIRAQIKVNTHQTTKSAPKQAPSSDTHSPFLPHRCTDASLRAQYTHLYTSAALHLPRRFSKIAVESPPSDSRSRTGPLTTRSNAISAFARLYSVPMK